MIVTEVPARIFAVHADRHGTLWLFGIDPLGHYWMASSFHQCKWMFVTQHHVRVLYRSLAKGGWDNDNRSL